MLLSSHLPAGLICGAKQWPHCPSRSPATRQGRLWLVEAGWTLLVASWEESQLPNPEGPCHRLCRRGETGAWSRGPRWEWTLRACAHLGKAPFLKGAPTRGLQLMPRLLRISLPSPYPAEGVSSLVYSLQSGLRAFHQSQEREGPRCQTFGGSETFSVTHLRD